MQFKEDAPIVSRDNEKVGKLDRVVLDPNTREVTHLVISKGTLFKTEKVVPISAVRSASAEGVTLSHSADELDRLPVFEENAYLPADERISAGSAGGVSGGNVSGPRHFYWFPITQYPIGSPLAAPVPPVSGASYPGVGYEVDTKRNIPEETVPLKVGAKVMSADEVRVGEIEQVITDAESRQANHFVLARGLIFKDRKLVPSDWVATVTEDEVWLNVNASRLGELVDYGG